MGRNISAVARKNIKLKTLLETLYTCVHLYTLIYKYISARRMSAKGRGRATATSAPAASSAPAAPAPVQSTEETGLDSRLTISNTDPDKRYFVYFIHESGRRGDNMPIKVGACNDVGEYRKTLESGRESDLKTYAVIKCVRGDAEAIITAFVSKYSNNHIKNGWFTGGKAIVDAFIADMEKSGYEKITEGRAKLLKSGARAPRAVAATNMAAEHAPAAAEAPLPTPRPKRPATPKHVT